ncbi:hypothetical protein [Promicromonospora sp. MEB111]|uniref:hypothetical protein n=1 Tax=Promicromonospora sp. MEB111 TaxID=3040301 RepID=UPI002551923C|nr:hypothetical protein [Promicromonospora sp. MEB111]
MRIALLVDGLESTRQYHADDGRSVVDACARLTAAGKPVAVDVVRDAECGPLLATLTGSQYDAVVFASNALRHPDGRVGAAVREHAEELTAFLAQGRGLVLLHQFTAADLHLETPDGSSLTFDRRGATPARPRIAEPASPVVRYPFHVDLDAELSSSGQLGDLTSWLSIPSSALSGLVTVVGSAEGEPLLAVSAEHVPWRVVVSAMPLDWHGAVGLLANCIEYACTGTPEVVVWPSSTDTPLAATLGHLRNAHRVRQDDPAESWLRARPNLHVVSTAETADPHRFIEATRNGGLVLATEAADDAGTVLFTGRASARQHVLARDFFAADPASLLRGPTLDPFPTRNVVVAASYYCRTVPSTGTEQWDPRQDRELHARLPSLFYEGMTISSALAAAQILCAVDARSSLTSDAVARVRALSPGDALSEVLLLGCEVAAGSADVRAFAEGLDGLDRSRLSAPDILRLLDWVGFLVLVLDVDSAAPALRGAVSRLVGALRQVTADDDVWLSHEGTATVVLATAAVGRDAGDLQTIARSVASLRAEYHDVVSSEANLGAAARYGQALAAMESVAPLVLDTLVAAAALDHVPDGDTGPADDHRHAASLAARNRALMGVVESERARRARLGPVIVIGTVVSWALALGVVLAGAGLILFVWRWPDVAQLVTAPAVLAWLFLVAAIARLLERMAVLPRPLGRLATRLGSEVRRRVRG